MTGRAMFPVRFGSRVLPSALPAATRLVRHHDDPLREVTWVVVESANLGEWEPGQEPTRLQSLAHLFSWGMTGESQEVRADDQQQPLTLVNSQQPADPLDSSHNLSSSPAPEEVLRPPDPVPMRGEVAVHEHVLTPPAAVKPRRGRGAE